jgi:RNA polymerase sigma-70 factor, ECF subfamily
VNIPPMKCWLNASRRATSSPCRYCSPGIAPRSIAGSTGSSLAEDLLSDVFFDVWQQAGRFEGRSAVSTWLLSIARFKALSARRRRTHAELNEVIEATVADSADNAEVVLEKKHQGEMLRDALSKLSPEHREIIDLVYYHEKSVDDAADILSIPRATVKTRMFYARKKLAELVQAA